MDEDELIEMSKDILNRWIKQYYLVDGIEEPLYNIYVNITDSIPYGHKDNIQYFRALLDCTLFNDGIDNAIFEFIYDTIEDKIYFSEFKETRTQECNIGGKLDE